MDVRRLWNERVGAFTREALGYMRYIANSGTIMFLVFAFSLAAYYYGQLLTSLPRTYPVEWLIIFLFSLLITAGTIRTLLKEADLVFLLPLEGRMRPYFNGAIVYTFSFHAVYSFLLLLAVWPLYTHRTGERSEPFVLLLVFILVLKLVNVLGKWQEMRLRERQARAMHMLLRFVANAAVLSILFTQGFTLAVLLAVLAFLAAAFFYYRMLSRGQLHWEYLVQKEKQARGRFYSFVNQFIDVPHMENKVRRRTWAAMLVNRIAFAQRNTYVYLYGKVFVRSDLLGMCLRLTMIGLLVTSLIYDIWGKLAAYFIVLALTAAQLSTLRQHYRYVFWTHIYPVSREARGDAIVRVVFTVMLIQATVLYAAVLIPFVPGWHWAIAPVIGIGFSYVYSHRILAKKLL